MSGARRRRWAGAIVAGSVTAAFYAWSAATMPSPMHRRPDLAMAEAAFVVLAGGWLWIRRMHFPESRSWVAVGGAVLLGLGSCTHLALREPGPAGRGIAAASALAEAGLFCLYGGLAGRLRAVWWGTAGVLFGFAAVCWPAAGLGAVALLLPLRWGWWRVRPGGGRGLIATAAAFAAVAGLGWLVRPADVSGWHPRGAGLGLHFVALYLTPPGLSPFFPFLKPSAFSAGPAGSTEFSGGLLLLLPFGLLALAAPLAVAKAGAARSRLARFVIALAVFQVGIAAGLAWLGGFAQEALPALAPSLMLLACIGLLGVERIAGRGRFAARGGAVAAGAATVTAALLLNFQWHDSLREVSPVLYRGLAHALDEPAAAWERWTGTRFGPLDLYLRLPAASPLSREWLVATGHPPRDDRLAVRYLRDGRIEFGFVHGGRDQGWSRPWSGDRRALHLLHLEMGSLYPPLEHPFFDSVAPSRARAMARTARIVLDGTPLYEAAGEFYEADPGSVRLDRDGVGGFSGEIYGFRRGRWGESAPDLAAFGPIRMTVEMPPIPARAAWPLISVGPARVGGTLFMRADGPDRVRFAYDQWGTGLLQSGSVAILPAADHRIGLRLPALQPPPDSPASRLERTTAVVEWDGRIVWAVRIPGGTAASAPVEFGRNGAEVTSCQATFPGRILKVGAFAPQAPPVAAGTGRIRLELSWPSGRAGHREPLVVTGRPGRADLLTVEYQDDGRIQFALDHWGVSLDRSPPIPGGFGAVHGVDVALPTLDHPGGGEYIGETEISIDGTVVWRVRSRLYGADPGTLELGENRIGGSCDPEFTGGVVAAILPGRPPKAE